MVNYKQQANHCFHWFPVTWRFNGYRCFAHPKRLNNQIGYSQVGQPFDIRISYTTGREYGREYNQYLTS